MGKTRLDRLLVLLDTGSTRAHREMAAKEIGALVRLHPHDLQQLMCRVHNFLRSKSFETRVAAGMAFRSIADNVNQWEPKLADKDDAGAEEQAHVLEGFERMLSFETFDLEFILEHGPRLLGSSGLEYLEDDELKHLSPRQRLIRQRENLTKQLRQSMGGSGDDVGGGGGGVKVEDLVSEEDLMAQPTKRAKVEPKDAAASQRVADSLRGLSARQINAMKRKKKQQKKAPKQSVYTGRDASASSASSSSKSSKAMLTEQADKDKVVVETKIDADAVFANADEWPFQARCEEMCNDLFDPDWGIRHGAAVGLRELISRHGATAGIIQHSDTAATQSRHNSRWLEDMAIRLICVLALDRFGDFSSTQAVAPVREMAAQALGAVVKHMSAASVRRVLMLLLRLEQQHDWEVRHGGLLGVKYFAAVRDDLVVSLLPDLLPVMLQGLQERDVDDVRAAAADTMIPMADHVVAHAPDTIKTIVTLLWDALPELDDLSASAGSILKLLARLLNHLTAQNPESISHTHTGGVALEDLMNRLWAFFRHPRTAIRTTVLHATREIVEAAARASVQSFFEVVLPHALVHTFQNLLLEDDGDVLEASKGVWMACLTHATPAQVAKALPNTQLLNFFRLLMTAQNTPITKAYLVRAGHGGGGGGGGVIVTSADGSSVVSDGGPENIYLAGDQPLSHDEYVLMRARYSAAAALGQLTAKWTCTGEMPKTLANLTFQMLQADARKKGTAPSSVRRLLGGVIVTSWATHARTTFADSDKTAIPDAIPDTMLTVLKEDSLYLEMTKLISRVQRACLELIDLYSRCGVPFEEVSKIDTATEFSFDRAMAFQEQTLPVWRTLLPTPDAGIDQRRAREAELSELLSAITAEFTISTMRVRSSLAAGVIATGRLPDKITALVKPLLESLSKEELPFLQQQSAAALARLIRLSIHNSPAACSKICGRVIKWLFADRTYCPTAAHDSRVVAAEGVLTLMHMEDEEQRVQAALARKKKSRRAEVEDVDEIAAAAIGADDDSDDSSAQEQQRATIQRMGAELALSATIYAFGADTLVQLPFLLESPRATLASVLAPRRAPEGTAAPVPEDLSAPSTEEATAVTEALVTLQAILPRLPETLKEEVLSFLPDILTATRYPSVGVRFAAAHTLAAMAAVEHLRVRVLVAVIDTVLPFLGDTKHVLRRQGAAEVCHVLTHTLDLDIIPFLIILVIPIMGRMSDFDASVRKLVANTFGTLVRLMPLESGRPDPADMPAALVAMKAKQRSFLEQLMDISKLERYALPVRIRATLRSYQQTGLDWMMFLNKYQLHGILCDDMGLGKTLQSICVMAADHHERAEKFAQTKQADCQHLPSLVVCPSILTTHWRTEIHKFCDSLRPIVYAGPRASRTRMRDTLADHDVVIMSYEMLRNDIEFLQTLHVNYCILDEGHIIRNAKSKIAQAAKAIQSNHRLILSGTPIQNNALELWSLFDFLMPGFLGTAQQFKAQYSKPILAARDAKASKSDQERGALALEALHRQVLPFLLRRVKEDVLDDLPPKIIQDYLCDLSGVQRRMYESFGQTSQAQAAKDVVRAGHDSGDRKGGKHIFQALNFLKRVCSHPLMVKADDVDAKVRAHIAQHGINLHDVHHATKLAALHQLLSDCSIGVSADATAAAASSHRALIFATHKQLLSLVARDLFDRHMPALTYRRLDGDTPTHMRAEVVAEFNDDPTVDVLLLTTSVGGLGLNLTGADTVIFLEHDWNPMKDLQAMDRAHRIGQGRTVNVYRLITRNTLEEKIMNLQRFKLNMANTIVSKDNSSLASMGTDQVLDLFTLSEKPQEGEGGAEGEDGTAAASGGGSSSSGLRAILEEAEKLDEDVDYSDYNVDAFMKKMH
ncbi:BTAF1 protein [Salpingoeca rosetta]|uniref:BTAF1 protein n=1 Tax=Salpingoeca rosetta (strain ATCC 50818 / BSB-021) TaxID=946362 RepID=F2UIC1_SALR5|nr:BTAF1 protein [Salpingoeca rosetta]EGD76870.1 BTAF1 protein [Salpingoeca rosetta]|eukprot:XP_004991242.1 BTAF1 protein [Salpingoeca rosetta]